MARITYPQLLFFISQLLYQSLGLFIPIQSRPSHSQFLDIHSIIGSVPNNIRSALSYIICLFAIFGWFQFLIMKKASYIIAIIGLIGIPIVGCMSSVDLSNEINLQERVINLFPTMFLVLLQVFRAVSVTLSYQNHSFNKLTAYSQYQTLFFSLRLILISILSITLPKDIFLYFILIQQLGNTLHKSLYQDYYRPQIQWISIVMEIWGWVSAFNLIEIIFTNSVTQQPQKGFANWMMLAILLLLFYFCFFPSQKLVIPFEKKIMSILHKLEKERNSQIDVYYITLYASVKTQSCQTFLKNCWTEKFKLFLELRIIQSNPLNPREILSNEFKNSCEAVNFLPSLLLIKNYVKQHLDGLNFSSAYFLCSLFAQIYESEPKQVFEFYYRISSIFRKRKNWFYNIQIDILFQSICRLSRDKTYQGRYIEQIFVFSEFKLNLEKFVSNQENLISIINKCSYTKLFEYYSTKILLKRKMEDALIKFEFLHPGTITLIQYKYIFEKYVNNDQISSHYHLISNLKGMQMQKTKLISFKGRQDQDQSILICHWSSPQSGKLAFWNRTAQKSLSLETKGWNNCPLILLKDLLPDYWRQEHENKFRELKYLDQNYYHPQKQVYYLLSKTNRVLEAHGLKVIPYFELSASIYFLIKAKIQTKNELLIFPKFGWPLDQSNSLERKKVKLNTAVLQDGDTQKIFLNLSQIKDSYPFKMINQIYDDEEYNSICVRSIIIKIFNSEYIVQSKIKSSSIFVKNESLDFQILQSEFVSNFVFNSNIKQEKTIKKIYNFQKSKRQINLFPQESLKVRKSIVVFLTIFLVSSYMIFYCNFSLHSLLADSVEIKLNFQEFFTSSISYQSVFIVFCRHFRQQIIKGNLSPMISNDQKIIINSLHKILESIRSIPPTSPLFDILYSEKDMTNLFQVDKSIEIPLDHLLYFDIFQDLVLSKLNQNETQGWLLDYFEDYVLFSIKRELVNYSYLINGAIAEIDQIARKDIIQAQIYFYLFLVVLFCLFLSFFLSILKVSTSIDQRLQKIFNINDKELQILQLRKLKIFSYLQNQRRINDEEIDKLSFSNTRMSLTKRSIINKQQERMLQAGKTGHYLLSSIVLFFILLVCIYCSFSFLTTKDEIRRLEDITKNSFQFSKFNSDIFNLYYQILELVEKFDEIRKEATFNSELFSIWRQYQRLNTINATEVIKAMMVNSIIFKQVLFKSPCEWSEMCQIVQRNIYPYPFQLNYFLVSLRKLYLLLQEEQLQKQKINQLIQETYISVRSLSEITIWIGGLNKNQITSLNKKDTFWLIICAVGYCLFTLIICCQSSKMVKYGESYGREMLGVLPSSEVCKRKIFSQEINRILHRTGFASCLQPL